MRIIGGRWRSRRIVAPPSDKVRPTGDRVREAWMSIVGDDLPGARVADFFAGSGALGLEALSRGAASCEFVDLLPASLATVRKNVEALGAGAQATVRRGDVLRVARDAVPHAWDVVFADPPWDSGLAPELAAVWLEHPFARVLGVEHRWGDDMPVGGETRRYGDTAITFYRDATTSP